MEIAFAPDPRLKLRLALFAVIETAGLVSHISWPGMAGYTVWTAVLLGSFRRARIVEAKLQRQTVLAFIPFRWKRWSLSRFTDIEFVYKPGLFIGWSLLIGPGAWIIWRTLDWMFPFEFGAWQLRLRLVKGGKVIVWQGNSEKNFEKNLALLQANTGLPVDRAAR
jgi:hypothetical protein